MFSLPLPREATEQTCFLLSLSNRIVNTKCLPAIDFKEGGSVNPEGKGIGSGREAKEVSGNETWNFKGAAAGWVGAERQDALRCTACNSTCDLDTFEPAGAPDT